jgi:hypothetical protein
VGIVKKTERSGGNALRSGIGATPTGELLAEAVVQGLGSNEMAVRGPQTGHRLASQWHEGRPPLVEIGWGDHFWQCDRRDIIVQRLVGMGLGLG